MNNQEFLQKCIDQEKEYQFASFSRDDVWELGCAMVEAVQEFEGPVAVEIDLNSVMVFRYYPAGTGAFNEQWLNRKRKTVFVTEKSTIRIFAELQMKEETILHDMRMDPMEYADCGGGFPLRLKNGCVIGFIGTSGLTHFRDHEALIAGLDRYFAKHPEKK